MQGRRDLKRADDGFTLFELLIVIIILAILAGIVAFATGSSTANAATSSCQSDAKAFATALVEYKSAVGVFPGDPSLQIPGQVNPLSTYGLTWNGFGQIPLQLPGTYGLLGNPSSSDGTWTAPNGVIVGPFLRQLPSQQHYRIISDGQGGVFVLPPAGPGVSQPPQLGTTLDGFVVSNIIPSLHSDNNSLNFETDPAICSDPNVVK